MVKVVVFDDCPAVVLRDVAGTDSNRLSSVATEFRARPEVIVINAMRFDIFTHPNHQRWAAAALPGEVAVVDSILRSVNR